MPHIPYIVRQRPSLDCEYLAEAVLKMTLDLLIFLCVQTFPLFTLFRPTYSKTFPPRGRFLLFCFLVEIGAFVLHYFAHTRFALLWACVAGTAAAST